MSALTYKELTQKPKGKAMSDFDSLFRNKNWEAIANWQRLYTPWADENTIAEYIIFYKK